MKPTTAWRRRTQEPRVFVCAQCGLRVEIRFGDKDSRTRFCSLACRAAVDALKKKRTGGPGKGWAKGVQLKENNPVWKGDEAGYQALHLRVYKERGRPFPCSRCGLADPTTRYEWANLTDRYEDVNDYAAMCVKCHRRFDRSRRRAS